MSGRRIAEPKLAGKVVVVAHGAESSVYREHLDAGRFRRERSVDLRVRDVAAAE